VPPGGGPIPAGGGKTEKSQQMERTHSKKEKQREKIVRKKIKGTCKRRRETRQEWHITEKARIKRRGRREKVGRLERRTSGLGPRASRGGRKKKNNAGVVIRPHNKNTEKGEVEKKKKACVIKSRQYRTLRSSQGS